MNLGTLTVLATIVLGFSIIAATVYEQVRWELYRNEHRCVVVEIQRNVHVPDRVKYRCADGKEIVR